MVGGFVSRVLTLAAFAKDSATLNATVTDYSKLTITWNVKTLNASPAAINTDSPPSITDGWCGVGTIAGSGFASGGLIRILDIPAVGGSSQESTITVEETV